MPKASSTELLLTMLSISALSGCVPGGGAGARPTVSPALLGENLTCDSAAGNKSMAGVETNAIQGQGWQWLKRTSSTLAPGVIAKVEIEVDPTVYYEAFIVGPDRLRLDAQVAGPSGVQATGEYGGSGTGIHWSSTEQSRWTLQWGYADGPPSACVYLLVTAKKK